MSTSSVNNGRCCARAAIPADKASAKATTTRLIVLDEKVIDGKQRNPEPGRILRSIPYGRQSCGSLMIRSNDGYNLISTSSLQLERIEKPGGLLHGVGTIVRFCKDGLKHINPPRDMIYPGAHDEFRSLRLGEDS